LKGNFRQQNREKSDSTNLRTVGLLLKYSLLAGRNEDISIKAMLQQWDLLTA